MLALALEYHCLGHLSFELIESNFALERLNSQVTAFFPTLWPSTRPISGFLSVSTVGVDPSFFPSAKVAMILKNLTRLGGITSVPASQSTCDAHMYWQTTLHEPNRVLPASCTARRRGVPRAT